MSRWFKKHRLLAVLISISLLIICLVVLVEVFRLQGQYVAIRVFTFLTEWATILYASLTIPIAVAAFWAIRENRIVRLEERQQLERRLALEKIQQWAEDTFELLTRPSEERNIEGYLNELEGRILPVFARIVGILLASERIGGELFTVIGEISPKFTEFLWRLRSNQVIEKNKAEHGKVGLMQFASEAELTEARRELLEKLSHTMRLVTDILVP